MSMPLKQIPDDFSSFLESLMMAFAESATQPLSLIAGDETNGRSAHYIWAVAGQNVNIGQERIPVEMGALVDRYNKWVGSVVLPPELKRLRFISGIMLHPSHDGGERAGSFLDGLRGRAQDRWSMSGGGRQYHLGFDVEPTRIVGEGAEEGWRQVAALGGDRQPADDMRRAFLSSYELALRSLELTRLRADFQLEKRQGRCELHCMLKASVGCELPHAWYVPQIVVQGAGNLLLKLGLKLGGDGLLKEIEWMLHQKQWLQRRRAQSFASRHAEPHAHPQGQEGGRD